MAAPLSTSALSDDWSGASLLLAADIAGTLHCYVYTSSPTPSLEPLWTRRLDDGDNATATAQAVSTEPGSAHERSPPAPLAAASTTSKGKDTLDTSRFHCILSKRLSRLRPPPPPVRSSLDGGDNRSTAFVSVDTNVFNEVSTSTTENYSSGGLHSVAGEQHSCDTLHGSTLEQPKAAVHTSAKPSPTLCPFCATPSLSSSPLSTEDSVSITTVSTSPQLSPTTTTTATSTASRRVDKGESHGTVHGNAPHFQCSDFMARLPAVTAAAAPPPHDAAGPEASSPMDTLASPAVASGNEETTWYWRCSRGAHADPTPNTNATSPDKMNADVVGDPSAHTWLSLSDAVRHWNRSCCQRHRLLLLRKMEETCEELDLFTGEPLTTAGWTSDLFAAAAHGSMDSAPSSASSQMAERESIHNDESSSERSDSKATSSTASDTAAAVPSAVLSLTVTRSQAFIMQAPSRVSKAKTHGKSKNGKMAKANGSPIPGAATTQPTCLIKLAAPTLQFAVTWYPLDSSMAAAATDASSSDDDAGCSATACPSTAARRPSSEHHAAHVQNSSDEKSEQEEKSASHHSSTSASDIDMDILSGRKRLPPQYHFVRPASSDTTASSESSTTTSSSSSSDGQDRHNVVPSERANGHGHSATDGADMNRRGADDDVPVRCGRGGEIYSTKAIHREENTKEVKTAPQPILQLPVPLVQAVWVCLPPATSAHSKGVEEVDGDEDRHSNDASTCEARCVAPAVSASFPLLVRPVPWLLEHACALTTAAGVQNGAAAPPLRPGPSKMDSKTKSDVDRASSQSTLHGFLLRTDRRSKSINSTTRPSADLHGCPQILRPLSTLDVRCSRQQHHLHGRRDPHNRSLLAFDSHYVKGEYVGDASPSPRRRGTREGSPQKARANACRDDRDDSDYPCRERGRHRDPYPHAFVQRESTRGGDWSRSSASSLMEDGSVTQRIAPLPPHFVPATSFFDENFEPLTILGRGVGGAVLLARHRVTGVFYAVKVLVARDYESERDILQEVRVHAMLENKYVVRYHACWSEVITATRAQQLAFIGVCHPHEANLPRRPRLTAAGDQRGSSIGRPPRPPANPRQASPNASEDDLTWRGGRGSASRRRAAPGGWDRLVLPSHSSMLLVGSESASESVSPVTTVRRPSPQLRSAHWSTAIVDEYGEADESEETEAEEEDEENERASGSAGGAFVSGTVRASPSSKAARRGQGSGVSRRFPTRNGSSAGTARTGFAKCSDGDDSAVESQGEDEEDNASDSHERSGHGEDHTIIGSRVVFLQMEFCQVTLAHYLSSRASLNRVENLIILLQIVAGLRYLHRRGVLHRDLKPTNVFMDYRCQYDKVVHSPNSSSSSSSDDSSEDGGGDGHRSTAVWAVSPMTQVHGTNSFGRGATSVLSHSSSWGEDSANPAPCTALTLRSQRRFPLPSHPAPRGGLSSSNSNGDMRGLPGFYKAMDPVTALQLASNEATFDSQPTWDGERSALDVVLRTAHHDASFLLQARLARRPPPTQAAGAAATERGDSGRLLRHHEGKAFLHHLASWLCHHFVQVRLGDFGLAKYLYQQDIRVDGFVSLNAANTVGVGSPLYASPEQLKGDRCTPASDAFSVGVMMAEMYLQPTTIAERLTVLREVRDGVYEDAALLTRYPELKLVRRLTAAQAERRATLAATQTALKAALLKALQDEVHRHYT